MVNLVSLLRVSFLIIKELTIGLHGSAWIDLNNCKHFFFFFKFNLVNCILNLSDSYQFNQAIVTIIVGSSYCCCCCGS